MLSLGQHFLVKIRRGSPQFQLNAPSQQRELSTNQRCMRHALLRRITSAKPHSVLARSNRGCGSRECLVGIEALGQAFQLPTTSWSNGHGLTGSGFLDRCQQHSETAFGKPNQETSTAGNSSKVRPGFYFHHLHVSCFLSQQVYGRGFQPSRKSNQEWYVVQDNIS